MDYISNPTKEDVIKSIEEYKLIGILRDVPKEKLVALANALYDGGIRLLEVPFSGDDDKTTEKIMMLSKEFKGRMFIGAGTVLTEEQVLMTKSAGGSFIISPHTDSEVIKKTVDNGMVSIPGAMTPTEIVFASKCGADFVKLFPATSVSRDHIKAVLAPLSKVKMIAVGGVNTKNMREFFEMGAVACGIGSAIADKTLLDKEDFKAITENALKYTSQL